MVTAQQMTGLQANIAALAKAQQQVTTGKRLTAASDDPAAAAGIMNAGSSLRALEQYRTNVQRASSRVNIEDATLSQLGDLISRVKTLGLAQADDSASAQTRSVSNAEVNQIFKQIVELGNTKFGNEYLFGGQQSTTAPFAASGSGATLDYSTTTPQGSRAIGVGEGQTVTATHDGKQVFLDTGVLDAVKALSQSLDPASVTYGQAGIASALTKIDSAFHSVQNVVGDTGATANRLSSVSQNLDALKTNLTTFKSNLEEVDVESAMTELTSRQVAYQAALLATTKVTSLSLADYLR